MTRALAVAALLALAACIDGLGEEPVPHSGDMALFEARAQPVLEARCASPSCHGNGERPLEIYAPLLHRIDDDDVFLRQPLTAEELSRNALRAAAFVGDLPGGASSLLQKPLDPAAGGDEHSGGAQLFATSDRDYLDLAAWCESVEQP